MKKILILPLSLVLLIIIVFILAGTPLVLNFAKSKITSIIQSQIGIPVSIGSLQGNLLYKTRIYNLKIGEVAEIESISVSYNIFALLSKRIEINYLLVDGISVDVNKATELTNNLKPEEQKKTKGAHTPFQISIKRLEINNVHIGGLINKKKLTMSLDLRGLLVNQVFIADYFYLQTKNSYVSVKGNIPLNDNNHYAIRYSLHIVPEEFGI
ncbi:MAG: hypothetical protein ABIL22_04850, partial [candidate division WOR-3 bacterium]